MKTLKSGIGMLLGGLGALTGIGLFANACSDNSGKPAAHEYTVKEIEQCCGTDKTSQAYAVCVQAYQENGVCAHPIVDDIHDKPLYGVPIPPQISDPYWCCGPQPGRCAEDYQNSGICPNDIDPAKARACCEEREDRDVCILDYIKFGGVCSERDDPPAPEYGPEPQHEPDENEICDCCCDNFGLVDTICENDFKETGVCHNQDMLECCTDVYDNDIGDNKYQYIDAICLEQMRKEGQCSRDLKDCCGKTDGTYDDMCLERFALTSQCDQKLNGCCRNDDGSLDPTCLSAYTPSSDPIPEYMCLKKAKECCSREDGSINTACQKILMKTDQCVNDAEMLDCCSKNIYPDTPDTWDTISVSFTCIKYYKKSSRNNVCAYADDVNGGIATIYGGDFRPMPYEWCDDYIGDYQKCIDFVACDVPLIEEEAKQCCGEDDQSDRYKNCANTYREKGKTEACIVPLEPGEPAPNTNPTECCGKFRDLENIWNGADGPWRECVEGYLKSGVCSNSDEPIDPVYGSPEPPDE